MNPLDLAALTAAGYAQRNVLDAALDDAPHRDRVAWLRASRCHLIWDATCGITVERS